MPKSKQRTFAIIKPDAFAAGFQGAILERIQESGLKIVAARTVHLSEDQAKGFYHVHHGQPFFAGLVSFMSQGLILALVLEGEDAIKRWRDLMGPTNAEEAPKGTIRGDFGTSIERNATHGSDADSTAAFEIGYFFSVLELSGF